MMKLLLQNNPIYFNEYNKSKYICGVDIGINNDINVTYMIIYKNNKIIIKEFK